MEAVRRQAKREGKRATVEPVRRQAKGEGKKRATGEAVRRQAAKGEGKKRATVEAVPVRRQAKGEGKKRVTVEAVPVRRQAKGDGKKRARVEAPDGNQLGAFEVLPEELVVSILAAVSSSADKPADLFSAMLVCKKFGELGMDPEVLKVASAACVSVRACKWSAAAGRFLSRCGDAGNSDANYLLGMIDFYCYSRRHEGWNRMMMAMVSYHAEAAFAAAVIRFNGTAAPDDDDKAGPHVAAGLFWIAACLGHVGALRDVAFCFSHGLGVRKVPATGRRLTVLANQLELCGRYPQGPARHAAFAHVARAIADGGRSCLGTAFGCLAAVPPSYEWAHPANRFLAEWFASCPGQPRLMCSMPTCGRPETRTLEFRRCPACTMARYCSRACQALHWRMGHRAECIPVHQWLLAALGNAGHVGAPAAALSADIAAAGNVGFPI